MGIPGLIIGLMIFMFSLFISINASLIFPNTIGSSLDIIKIGLIFLGTSSIFIGAMTK